MKKKQVILCGYYGYGNGGDEALLAALLQMLPPEVTPLVLSGNPAHTIALHGVEACDRYQPIAVLKALLTSQGFIWGGGSLIQDATSAISPLYYLGLMLLAQRLGLKTVAWAQGIGPLKRGQIKWLAERVFRGCTAVSVRDRAAMELLNRWQIPGFQAADPVWALTPSPSDQFGNLPSEAVALVLRSHAQLTSDRQQVLIQALSKFQTATGATILLIPFQASQDLAIAETIHAALPETSQVIQLEDPRQLKGVFKGVRMAIAMRLHGLIMAAAEGCRCFALSYDPKVSQLMTELNLPGWELSALPTEPDLIAATWLEHYTRTDPLTQEEIMALVDQASQHQTLLFEVFHED